MTTLLLPLYKLYRLETALEEVEREKIWLNSGGFLVIQQTEAFVSIDVNSGKYTGKKKAEETYRKINLEAARRDRTPDPPSESLRDHPDRFYQYGESGPYGRAVPCASETPPQRPGEMQGCGYHASPYPGDDKEESETAGSGRTSRDKKVK